MQVHDGLSVSRVACAAGAKSNIHAAILGIRAAPASRQQKQPPMQHLAATAGRFPT
jgi:hypothetical protein